MSQKFNCHCQNFSGWLKLKMWETCRVIVCNLLISKLPHFIRRFTTVSKALKVMTHRVLKGHMVPQWQCFRAVHTISEWHLGDQFLPFNWSGSMGHIKLPSSFRLNLLNLRTLLRVYASLYLISLLWHSLFQGLFQPFCVIKECFSRSLNKTLKVKLNWWHT